MEVSSNKFVIYPKKAGITEDVFESNGRIALVRVVYKQKQNNDYKFNYMLFGDNELKFYNIFNVYNFPSNLSDYPFNFKFKKGDKFVLSTVDEIEKITLWFAQEINIARGLVLKTSGDINNK